MLPFTIPGEKEGNPMPIDIRPTRCIKNSVEYFAYRKARSGRTVRRTICFGGLSIFFWTETGVIS